MKLTQYQYELCTFLNNCVYNELAYPPYLHMTNRVVKASGLRMEIFDLREGIFVVICGTNSLKDWLANFKVALGIVPNQHKQALAIVKDELCKAQVKGKPLICSGHSLGSGIVEYCIANLGNIEYDNYMGIGYNGCGVKHLGGYVKKGKMINVGTSRDILNGITERLPFKKYMQHFTPLNIVKDTTTWNPIKSHSNFEVMMKCNIKTIVEGIDNL